jgi:hypothetical protein
MAVVWDILLVALACALVILIGVALLVALFYLTVGPIDFGD